MESAFNPENAWTRYGVRGVRLGHELLKVFNYEVSPVEAKENVLRDLRRQITEFQQFEEQPGSGFWIVGGRSNREPLSWGSRCNIVYHLTVFTVLWRRDRARYSAQYPASRAAASKVRCRFSRAMV